MGQQRLPCQSQGREHIILVSILPRHFILGPSQPTQLPLIDRYGAYDAAMRPIRESFSMVLGSKKTRVRCISAFSVLKWYPALVDRTNLSKMHVRLNFCIQEADVQRGSNMIWRWPECLHVPMRTLPYLTDLN